ncbi:MAG: hypothetical protein DRQ55_02640 [Planctomycetota bacterium]|nr:MAG: hypothetical protein DRQ55_02640 [Planctomycetota bacterium]
MATARPAAARAHGQRALLIALLAALTLGCGGASRMEFARRDFVAVYKDPEALERLRGAEPRVVMLWTESARVASIESTDAALAVVRDGLGFHPADPGLQMAQIELLEKLKQHEESLSAARETLGRLPPQTMRVALLHSQLRNLLALGRVDEAWVTAHRLAGVFNSPVGAQADAWARVALELALLGRLEDADECLDRSLARGPNGIGSMMALGVQQPETRAASRTLRERALEHHPRHPDLRLTQVVDLMESERYPEAEAAIDTLPAPLPSRLSSDLAALHARLHIVQGRVEQGLELLFARLDDEPADRPALAVLEQTWATLGQPPDVVMEYRLRQARPRIGRSERQRLDRLLAAIAERRAGRMGPANEPASDVSAETDAQPAADS